MKLLLAIPAYNEAAVIVPTVEAVAEVLAGIPSLSWHIVVVDNASSDGTAQRVRECGLEHTSVITTKEKGKGLAIRTAAALAADTGVDLFGFIDADLSAHPSSIPLLLEALNKGADIAIGSRLLHPSRVKRGAFRTASSRIFNFLRRALLGINVVDSQCGLKIMNNDGLQVLQHCTESTWFLDMELLARAQKKKLRIAELPIVWNEYYYKDRESKLSVWRDGLAAFGAMFRIRALVKHAPPIFSWIVLGFATGILLVASTYKLSEAPAIWLDEGLYTQAAMNVAEYGTQGLMVSPGHFVSSDILTVGYPLLYPVAFAYRLFGVGVVQGRMVMVAYILLLFIVSYSLIKRLFGHWPAALSALLLATFPMLYGNGKSVLGEVPGLFFLVCVLTSLVYLERGKYRDLRWYFAFGFAAGLCVATKPIFILLIGAFFFTYVLRFMRIPFTWLGGMTGTVGFLLPLLLWAHLQFGSSDSLTSIFAFYANPHAITDLRALVLQNARALFTDSSRLYLLAMMCVWSAALWVRRKNKTVSSAEIAAFIFFMLIMLNYLRLEGWTRYLFPAFIVAMLFLPSSLLTISGYLRTFFKQNKLRTVLTLSPYILLAFLASYQLLQTIDGSYVAGYYGATRTRDVSEALRPLGANSSFFLYFVPEVAILIPSQMYYQYIPLTDKTIVGKEELAVLQAGTAEYVVVGSDTYRQTQDLFSRYVLYKIVDRYDILRSSAKQ